MDRQCGEALGARFGGHVLEGSAGCGPSLARVSEIPASLTPLPRPTAVGLGNAPLAFQCPRACAEAAVHATAPVVDVTARLPVEHSRGLTGMAVAACGAALWPLRAIHAVERFAETNLPDHAEELTHAGSVVSFFLARHGVSPFRIVDLLPSSVRLNKDT